MKKLLSYLLLSSVSLPFLSSPAKADTPTNIYADIIDDYIFPNGALAEITCSSFIGSGENDDDVGCTSFGLGPAIDQNHTNIISNYNNIQTNSTDIDTNTTNITSNASDIDNIQTLQGSTTTDVTANTNNIKRLGEGVAGSTALTAALSALPQMSKESKTTCGVGTGAYSSRYAVGFGCASKLNERVDVNAGGSYVFGGSKSYGGGTLDSSAVKAGFVFKLGELNKPTQILSLIHI